MVAAPGVRWLLVALLIPLPLLAMLPSAPQARAFTPVRPVLAWYYGWYAGPENWQKTADLPPELYNSYDDATMRRQIRQAKAAGIDGFICTWRYNCPRLIELAADEGGFGVAISIDPVATQMPTFDDVVANIQAVTALMNHPGYLRWSDGRPILVFWSSQILPGDTSVVAFQRLRAATDPDRQQFWLGGGDDFAYLDIFDALQYFDISWESAPGFAMASYARRLSTYNSSHGTQKPFIATVMPGYDDRAVRGGRVRDREDGAYYRATWDAALAYQPQAIVITSWNEWYEGSQIEPSRTYGTRYLDITREKTTAYRLGSGIGDPAFLRLWQRTDLPVLQNRVSRSWVWGLPRAGARYEPYGNGQRLVQYFDKARMEINDPNGDRSSPWFVTTGLLAWELVTGNVQMSNDRFEHHTPATIPIAGDLDDPTAPTYASFSNLLDNPALPVGSEIRAVVDRNGRVTQDGPGGVTAAYYVPETNHTIASPFWEFLNRQGLVYENGSYRHAQLFAPLFFVTGLPITEAYWVRVRVDGRAQWVLVQVFERRVLTYTPNNPPGWQVELGNIGLHYLLWREGQ